MDTNIEDMREAAVKKLCEDINWIKLAEEQIQWRALVNMAINIQMP
jgi:translation elongation factor EF-1beta